MVLPDKFAFVPRAKPRLCRRTWAGDEKIVVSLTDWLNLPDPEPTVTLRVVDVERSAIIPAGYALTINPAHLHARCHPSRVPNAVTSNPRSRSPTPSLIGIPYDFTLMNPTEGSCFFCSAQLDGNFGGHRG
jgi:hypothetical protein